MSTGVGRRLRQSGPTIAVALIASAWRSAVPDNQANWIADVSVRSIDVTSIRDRSSRVTRIVVSADGNRASAVQVEVILPVGVGVVHVADGCRTSPGPVASLTARVTCTLGDLPVRESRSIFVTTTGKPTAPQPRFAAFAFSDTPDPLPSNNYAERVVP